MLDIQFIRENSELVKQKSEQKGFAVDIDQLLGFDKKRRELIRQTEDLRRQRNDIVAQTKNQKPSEDVIEKGKQLKEQLLTIEHQLSAVDLKFSELHAKVPNMPLEDVPQGKSEAENVVIRKWGEIPNFDFEIKNHNDIGVAKSWIDKNRAAKVAGARFAYIKGDLALLEFALWNFALSILTNEEKLKEIISSSNLAVSNKPFSFVLPPAVAKKSVYESTGRLNKEEQTYKIEDEDLWLNASAEHTIAPMYLNEIIDQKDLPIRYVGYTTAFRREAGTYGKDMEGIIRLHQFNKMEMESFTSSEDSYAEHLFFIAIQEYLMQQLGLPYQVLEKCTGEIGFPNAKGVDLEAWIPSQNRYRETHTADYITNFQCESLKTRVKYSDGKIAYAHTNDATALSERPLIAIIENNQTRDGNVVVPDILVDYMSGKKEI